MPPALTAYRIAGQALSPLADAWLALRTRSGKEDPTRVQERYGRASAPRPHGALVWLHGASVGEARLLTSVRDALAARRNDLNFLITTGTRTSADLVARESHPRTIHQFAILDHHAPVRRFLDHWRPDLGVFAESEVWPNLILEAARRRVPLALINACMNMRSLANWARAKQTAARIFSCFDLIVPADKTTAAGLERLTGKPLNAAGNLKLAAAPSPVNEAERAAWRAAIASRPVWLAASTHVGEEEIILAAHAALRVRRPDALLLVAPRHPERGHAVAALANAAPRRSLGQRPCAEDPVFVVDTVGELNLFFALAPAVFMGGSLLATLEGHNPVEPSLAGAAVIAGPHVSSFADLYEALDESGALAKARNPDELAAQIEALWRNETVRAARVHAAQAVIARQAPALAQTIDSLVALLASKQGAHAPA